MPPIKSVFDLFVQGLHEYKYCRTSSYYFDNLKHITHYTNIITFDKSYLKGRCDEMA